MVGTVIADLYGHRLFLNASPSHRPRLTRRRAALLTHKCFAMVVEEQDYSEAISGLPASPRKVRRIWGYCSTATRPVSCLHY